MRRNTGQHNRFPGYYNQEMLEEARKAAGLSVRQVALKTKMNQDTTIRVFKGTASQKQVWPISSFFKINWATLHDLPPEQVEFDRAVFKGKAARSSGPAKVGVPQARSVKRGGTYTGTRG